MPTALSDCGHLIDLPISRVRIVRHTTKQARSAPSVVHQRCPTKMGWWWREGKPCMRVLNLYPYNSGHLMVCPYRHVASYIDLTSDEVAELAAFTQQAIRALQTAYAPQGFNIGMNQGTAGGAGIAAHLHQHVVPRWGGDTNFMPVIARTKVLPQSLADMRATVAAAWPAS